MSWVPCCYGALHDDCTCTPKRPTISELLARIEELEARVRALERRRRKARTGEGGVSV